MKSLSLEERRRYYHCKQDFTLVSDIVSWSDAYHKGLPAPKTLTRVPLMFDSRRVSASHGFQQPTAVRSCK